MNTFVEPSSIAAILDGNRRSETVHGWAWGEGHVRGYRKVKDFTHWCIRRGLATVTVWVFSTRNWRRDHREVEHLLGLFRLAFGHELAELHREGIRLKVIGHRGKPRPGIDAWQPLPDDLVRLIEQAEQKTAAGTAGLLQVALNYGGPDEILQATQRIIAQGIPADQVTPQTIADHLWTAGAKDPDIVIRTGSAYEPHTSGFLPLQTADSEWFFLDTLWPDFEERDLDEVLAQYRLRRRRQGS